MALTGKRWTPEEAMGNVRNRKVELVRRKKLGEPMRVYIAGPYSPSIIKDCSPHDASLYAQRHVDAAIAAAWDLMEMGYFPYIPHLSHYVHIQTPEYIAALPSAWWVKFDIAFLEPCDAILMIGDWRNSKGAVSELKYAKEHDMYIFYSMGDVPDTIAPMSERAIRGKTNEYVRFIDRDK